jgi:hypothetical protein
MFVCLYPFLQGAKGAAGATAGMDLLGGLAPLPGVMLPGLMPGLGGAAFAGASRIVVLKNAVEVEELNNPTDYEEIVQDMQVCCVVFGLCIRGRGCSGVRM